MNSGFKAVSLDSANNTFTIYSNSIADAGKYTIIVFGIEPLYGNSATSSFVLTIGLPLTVAPSFK